MVSNKGFSAVEALLVVIIVAAIGFAGWYVWDNNKEETDKKDRQSSSKQEEQQTSQTEMRIQSGKEAFSVVLPAGFGEVVRFTDADHIIKFGTEQPDLSSSQKVTVDDQKNLGTDSPFVFSISLSEATAQYIPEGDESAFTVGKESLEGKKYSYEYPADTEEGIGARLKGDKTYTYVFTLEDGRTLRAQYEVYGSDPQNLVKTIDDIVRSVKVK